MEQTPVLDLKKAFTAWGYRPAGVERGSEDAGLGAADGATACGEDGRNEGGGSVSELPWVTLRIGVPSSGEIEYTRVTQDNTETEINRLTVYDFIVKENTDGSEADTLAAGVQYRMEDEQALISSTIRSIQSFPIYYL